MKKNTLQFLFALSITLTVLQSCSKDGAQGPKGDTGATGATGVTGTANVKSVVYTVNQSDWNWLGSPLYLNTVSLINPYITQNVIDSGCVVGYYSPASPYTWNQLPFIYYPTSTQGHFISISAITLGRVQVRNYWTDGTNSVPSVSYYRIVSMSPTAKAAYPNTNWNNPKEVENVLIREGLK